MYVSVVTNKRQSILVLLSALLETLTALPFVTRFHKSKVKITLVLCGKCMKLKKRFFKWIKMTNPLGSLETGNYYNSSYLLLPHNTTEYTIQLRELLLPN